MSDAAIHRAADLIEDADALLIGAGAGMGVDSGLVITELGRRFRATGQA